MARRLKITTPYGNVYYIHEHGQIERGDGANGPGSESWVLLGITRADDTGGLIPVAQITRGMIEAKPMLDMNDHPIYTGVDKDHGTQRVWGNTEHHGIASIEVLDGEPITPFPVPESPKLTRYHFSFGNSTDGPIGFCAAVWAETPEEAVTLLQDRVMENERSIDEDDDVPTDGEQKGIEYVNVYFGGGAAITALGIDETEEAQ